VLIPEGIGEYELSVFAGLEGNFVDTASEEEEQVFRKEEVH
jgi:hypothetical protein